MRSIPSLIAVLCVPVLVLAQGGGWRANPDLVAREAAQRPDTNYDESRVPQCTRCPISWDAGKRPIATPAQWTARREEILGLFRDTVYGRSPERPRLVTFSVLEDNPRAMDGAATLRRIRIVSVQAERSHQFELTLFLPNTPGRVPVFLFINNRETSLTDPTRTEKSGFWPAERLIARGYGIAAFHYGQIAPDDKDRFRQGVMALFDSTGTATPAYTLGRGGGMGVGRQPRDGLPCDRRPRRRRARRDRRPLARRQGRALGRRRGSALRDGRVERVRGGRRRLEPPLYGETVARINTAFPHWFTAAYKTFNGREAALPVDQHMLLALVAPRALYVASADQDLWADPRGEFLSLAASSPVFALWGEPPIAPDAMPAIDTPFVSGRRGYHVRTGGHDLTPYDWDRFADFADRVWKK